MIFSALVCEFVSLGLVSGAYSLALHALASGLFYGGLRHRHSHLMGLAGASAVAILPGYGAVMLVIVWGAQRMLPRPSGELLSEFRDHVAPQLGLKPAPIGQLPLVEHLKVQPLIDLMDSPDIEIRKAVLEAMAKRRGRKLIECIQRALNDPKPEIYQLAVAKLAQIQEEHSRELAQARAAYQRDPQRTEAYLLVGAYQDYLDSGLLEPTLEPLYLEQLAEVYLQIQGLDGSDLQACLSRGQTFLRLAQPQHARQEYERALTLQPDSPEACMGVVEVLYLQRDWPGLREEVKKLRQLAPKLTPEMLIHVEWLCH